MKKLKILTITLIFIAIIVLFVWVYRQFSSTQIDDVSPQIQCDKQLLDKADILFVIPKFENKSMAENKTWCDDIAKLNKTIGMHGVYHDYNEFSVDRTSDYIQEGMDIFFQCFGYYPTEFKSPQLSVNIYNKQLIKSEMKFIGYWNQFFHKTYHCGDSGQLSNNFIRWI